MDGVPLASFPPALLGLPGDLLLSLLQSAAALLDPAQVALVQSRGRGFIDGSRRALGRGRDPEIGIELHRLIA